MEESGKGIVSAIELAISKCTSCHKPVVKRKHGPVNAWYDDECNNARQAASRAEHQHCSSSELAGTLHKEYKRILRKKKRKWLETRMENLHTKLRHNPKSFWNSGIIMARRGWEAEADLGSDKWWALAMRSSTRW